MVTTSTDNLFILAGEVENTYVTAYSRPGALRAAFDTYRAFTADAADNRCHLQQHGKSSTVPALAMAGEDFFNAERPKEQLEEFYESVEEYLVKNSCHYISDEAPVEMAEAILGWVEKHGG
jgi:pimeloyl-ACP methyl ester carboxylesterase